MRNPAHTVDCARLVFHRMLMLLCLLSGGVMPGPLHAADSYSEEAVKAAFIFRFVGYVKWPEAALPPHFTIAVIGADEVADNLQSLLAGRPLLNRPVTIRRVNSLREAAGAQVLFIGKGGRREQRRLATQGAGSGVLVITESAQGMPAGGIINFMVVDQRVRFQIAQETAEAAGLKISSDLLALALRGKE